MKHPNFKRTVAKYAGDIILISAAYFLALHVAAGGGFGTDLWEFYLVTLPVVLLVKLGLLYWFHQYDSFWRYTSLRELYSLVRALSLAAGLIFLGSLMAPHPSSSTGAALLLDWIFGLVFLGGFRIAPRILRENGLEGGYRSQRRISGQDSQPAHVLLYGAGDLGASIARQIERTYFGKRRVIGFLDDDPQLWKRWIHGIEVLGGRTILAELSRKHRIDEILVSISAISGKELNEIVQHCRRFCRSVQVAPGLNELFMGMVRIGDMREVQIEDLLGRERLELDEGKLSEFLAGKRILVTGAGGSIGSELCFQILKYNPETLVLFGRGENSIYKAKVRLAPHARPGQVREVIGDIGNPSKLRRAFREFRPELVFHAAAHKHVPLMELNPDEAVRNNILGTRNVLEAAYRSGVQKVVCVSSDKAVNPTNVMGCCKRVSELLAQSYSSRLVSCAVRFGNVIGSRGSVVPLFKHQIAQGGPLTITDPDITRYFMTIPEAVLLVLQAGALSQGGEIFLLEMGQPIRIVDLAREMIRLSGVPEGKIRIEYVGLRPGEKLYEELTYPYEDLQKTSVSKLYRVGGRPVDETELDRRIGLLARAAEEMDIATIHSGLSGLVPEYRPLIATPVAEPEETLVLATEAQVS